MGMAKGGHNGIGSNGAKRRRHRKSAQRASADSFHGCRQVNFMYTCEPCGKRAYRSRKDAKKVNMPGETAMREYMCPVDSAVWHVGHMPRSVKKGEATTREIYG